MTGFGTMRMIEREKPERTAAGMDAYGGKTGKAFSAGTAALAVCAIQKHTAGRKQHGAARTFIRAAPFVCLLSRSGDKNRRMTMRPCFEVVPTAGIEPARLSSRDFKSRASASSATSA